MGDMMSMRKEIVVALVMACVLSPLAFASEQPAETADLAGAFPYELAFGMRKLRPNDPPVASPDGARIAYVVVTPPAVPVQSVRALPNGTPTSAVGARIHLSGIGRNAAAEAPPICGGEGNQWNPSWSPDGRMLAFYSDVDGRPRLWIHRTEDASCRKAGDGVIRASLFAGFQAQWSPDGRTVYVPLRPDPPLETSDAENPISYDVRSAVGEDTQAPLVFYSGNEIEKGGQGIRADDYHGFLLANYNATLAAVDLAGGQTRALVDARAEPRPSAMKLSPSGRWLAYVSVPYRDPKAGAPVQDIVFVPTRGGEPRRLVEAVQSMGETDYRWHPDEDRLVYLAEGRAWVADFGADGPQAPRPLGADLGEPVPPVLYYTRDGESVVVGLDPQGRGRDRAPGALALVPLDGGPVRRVALPESAHWQFLGVLRADEDTLWQPDPRSLSVQVRNRSTGEQAVHRIEIGTGRHGSLTSGLFRLAQFAAGGNHEHLYAVYEDIATAPDIHRYNPGLVRQGRVSTVEPRVEGLRLGPARVIETRVPLYDGRMERVRTTLLLPHGAKAGDRLPAIVMIYSGSDLSTTATQYGGGMGNTVPSQVFTSRGYAVVMANIVLPPADEPSHPSQDIVDALLPQVYAAAQAGYIDVERLAVSGQSFGGYSAAAIVSQTRLFRAAIPVNGVYDLAGIYGGLDVQGNSPFIRWAEKDQARMGESPWANPLRYIVNSPYYRVDRIRTPMLIMAGEGDGVVPYAQSKQLFVGLRRLERPAQLALYPGEGHAIDGWSIAHAADASRRMVEFLRKHLGEP